MIDLVSDFLGSYPGLGFTFVAVIAALVSGWFLSPFRPRHKAGDPISREGEPHNPSSLGSEDVRIQKHDSEAEKIDAQFQREVLDGLAHEPTDPYESEPERIARLRTEAAERQARIDRAYEEFKQRRK